MRKGLGLGLFGAFLAAMVAPQLAKAEQQIPADGLSEGSGHWVTARYELDCKNENRLFIDATVHTRIVDGTGKEDCKGERLEISNRSSKPFHYGISESVSATVASGGVVTVYVPRPSDPEANTRVRLTGRHFADCGVGKMWKNGTCKDWEDPCPAGEARANLTDLWQAQGEDYSLSAIQWRIMNECYDDKGKFDSDDAECKTEVKRCEDQRSQISGNQHDHSTMMDLAFSDMRKSYLGQNYTIKDQKILEEPDNQISCGYTSRENMKKRSNDRHAIGERHWRVSVEYSNWLSWKQQVNRECSLKNNQAPKQIQTQTPKRYTEPTYGSGSGRKHGPSTTNPEPTRTNGQSLQKEEPRREGGHEQHQGAPKLQGHPLEQNNNHNNNGANPPTQSQSQPLQKNEPSRTQPPTSVNTPPNTQHREGGHENHQNTPKLEGKPLDQNLGKTGPSSPTVPNGLNGPNTHPVPLGVQAPPSVSGTSRTTPPTIADLGKRMEEERRERERQNSQHSLQAQQRAEHERAERERAERERHNQQNQQNDRMRMERERADRERNERASREAEQRRDEQRRQLEQQQRQQQDERRRQQQEESRRQQAEDSRRQREEEARRQRDEDRRRQQQEEQRRQQEEQRRQSQQRMQPSTPYGRRR